MPMIKVDLMIERIEDLGVLKNVPPGAIACLMTVVNDEGARLRFGFSRAALETLCAGLIASSPRTPGTPGRN